MPVISKCNERSKFFRDYLDIFVARERVNILWKQRDLMLKRLHKAQEQQTMIHNKHT